MKTRRQIFGQHFLKDQSVITKTLQAVEKEIAEKKPDVIVEVGPGRLALTALLAPLAEKTKLPLHLVERDKKLDKYIAPILKPGAVELHYMDAATDDFLNFLDSLIQKNLKNILFVSNLPYSASSQILANLCKRHKNISAAVIMIQKELADRMTASPGGKERGSFSLLMQSYFQSKTLFTVAPGAFIPPPKVMSSVLSLYSLNPAPIEKISNPEKFEKFCKKLFSGRRKMIRGLLPSSVGSHYESLGLTGQERPEAIDLDRMIELYKFACEGDSSWGNSL